MRRFLDANDPTVKKKEEKGKKKVTEEEKARKEFLHGKSEKKKYDG